MRGRVTGYEEVETDPGVIDKRLLVYEAEFSSILKVAGREGNILSEILRKAWETGNLRNTVKNNPMKATGAHIAIIGHITIDELQRTLTTTDAANGFGNRFLWLCVRRSKLLPDGGAFHTVNFNPLLTKLREVLTKPNLYSKCVEIRMRKRPGTRCILCFQRNALASLARYSPALKLKCFVSACSMPCSMGLPPYGRSTSMLRLPCGST